MLSNRNSKAVLCAIAMIGLTLAAAGTAGAAVIHVYEGELIQAAIDAAQSGDEIIVHPGAYIEAIDFAGKAIWLHSSDGPGVTIIDGNGAYHVVQCRSGEGPNTILEGFTITGGNANGTGVEKYGGGMFVETTSPTVVDCIFTGNTAVEEGGGMACRYSNPTVTNCTFADNSADWGGGMGNSAFSSPMVTNCTFIGNSGVMRGGGMSNVGCSPTVTNCAFIGNSAYSGGGMGNFAVAAESPTLTNCTFSGNTATSTGGAMWNAYESNPTVANCILWGDTPNEIGSLGSATAVVTFSDVQGGYSGAGNINANPLFIDPINDNYRLSPGSPCIDAGNSDALPPGITTDLDGNPRFVDDADTPDTGVGYPCVDIGAYEFQVAPPCPADINGDGTVNVLDLLLVLAAWGNTSGPEDINGDGIVNVLDLLEVLAAWGPCT